MAYLHDILNNYLHTLVNPEFTIRSAQRDGVFFRGGSKTSLTIRTDRKKINGSYSFERDFCSGLIVCVEVIHPMLLSGSVKFLSHYT